MNEGDAAGDMFFAIKSRALAMNTVPRLGNERDIANGVVSSAGEFVTLDACALALCDDEVEQMQVVSSTGFDPEPPAESFAIEHTEGLLAQWFSSSSPQTPPPAPPQPHPHSPSGPRSHRNP